MHQPENNKSKNLLMSATLTLTGGDDPKSKQHMTAGHVTRVKEGKLDRCLGGKTTASTAE